jgi:tetraacyldisaccharide 4'-kinase
MFWYEKLWYGNSRWTLALLPFSYLFQLLMTVRKLLYSMGFFHQHRIAVPVVVVGNITVGGTGKTPLVIALAKWLQEQGERPGIVSRGYRGRSKDYPRLVSPTSKTAEVGDEPVIIARHTGCPVMVDPNRVRAAKTLLAQSDCTIIISDDGLQHFRLARDIEILLVDGQRGFGNGYCLPAGPLRESASRAQNVDFIVSNGPGFSSEYSMSFQYSDITNILDPAIKLEQWQNTQPVFAITGIGNPQRFYNELQQQGFKIVKHAFHDHHQFNPTDFAFTDTAPVIMTEKDAVKCRDFAQHNWWYLPISAELPAQFWSAFAQRLQAIKATAKPASLTHAAGSPESYQ